MVPYRLGLLDAGLGQLDVGVPDVDVEVGLAGVQRRPVGQVAQALAVPHEHQLGQPLRLGGALQ